MEGRITELAQQALKHKLFPGVVIGVVGNSNQSKLADIVFGET